VMVLVGLAMIAFVAAQFSGRVDQLRGQARWEHEYAQAKLLELDAQAIGLYWLATRSPTFDGFGDERGYVRADGRAYRLNGGAFLAVADQSAFLSLNNVDRPALDLLLRKLGASPQLSDGLIDVLQDATDTDDLRRLNGAETAEYQRLGLNPPRNDWLISVRELSRMPLWRDQPNLATTISALTSARIGSQVNANLAPIPVLRAMLPGASEEQLRLFDTLRRAQPFVYGTTAQGATGLPFTNDALLFFVSDEQALKVWAPGLPRGVHFSVRLLPEAVEAPWRISDIHTFAPSQITLNADAPLLPLKFTDGKSN
jgi:general secretion pathway protein K